MNRGKTIYRLGLALAGIGCVAGILLAQSPDSATQQARPDRKQLTEPVYRVAQQPTDTQTVAVGPQTAQQSQPEHPLAPALQLAKSALENIEKNIGDYSATLVKQERISGKLNEPEYMFIKIRHEPFSAYTYFLKPARIKGQEAIYVQGKNNGNLLGHGVGIRGAIGMVSLKPDSMLAMQGQRYPITEIGILNLTKRLIEVAEHDSQFGECEVKFYRDAKINDRPATCIEVTHPYPRRNFKFHKARVYLDHELNIPVRYEAYEWPAAPGDEPPLLEAYTYLNVKLNNNFTDADFDDRNPNYNFH